MLCFNVPKKTAAIIRTWVCVVLILAAVIFSLTPIITLDLADEETAASVEEVINQLDFLDEDIEIPKELEVTTGKLLGSIGLLGKTISVMSQEDPDEEDVEKLEEMVKGEEGKNTFLLVAATVASVKDAFKSGTEDGKDNEDQGIFGTILNVLVVVVAFIYVLGFALIAPVVYIIVAIVALVKALASVKNPEANDKKVGKLLIGTLSFPMVFILFQCVLPTMHYGSGALALWILALATVLVNVVVSRLYKSTRRDIARLNVVQGVSLLSMIGYLVFFFNIIKTGVFVTFIKGTWGFAAAQAVAAAAAGEEVVSSAYIIDAILVVLAVVFVWSSTTYFKSSMERLSGTAKKSKDILLAGSIFTLISCVLPMVVKNSDHYYVNMLDLDSKPKGSFLDGLSSEGETALTVALVGAIIMIVAEIAMIVLKAVVLKKIPAEADDAAPEAAAPEAAEDASVAGGASPVAVSGSAANAAGGSAPVEETPVEETPVEEAPVEETPVEEAPVEEAPVEEAPAEEAPVEEAPAEEAPVEEAPAEEAAPVEETADVQ